MCHQWQRACLPNAVDKRSRFDPGLGKSPGGGHGNPLQYSYLTLILVFQISVTNFSHMSILSCHMYVSRFEKLEKKKTQFKVFFKIIFYWDVADLQCFVSFRYTTKWFSYTDTYIHKYVSPTLPIYPSLTYPMVIISLTQL